MKPQNSSPLMFHKEFTKQEPIPEEAIQRAVELMQSGRLHRYNTASGEDSDVSLLEKEFAEYVGSRYCVAFCSCGSSIYIALKCAGVRTGDKILSNAFTLAPVPGAIENAGATPIFIECSENYTIDLDDLERKACDSGSRFLLLSHMRGHIADMDRLCELCSKYGVKLIEDCAHTMGATWGNRQTGTFGLIGCFSAQTYKHINSGEGGLLVTTNNEIAAQAILYSGSYMLYDRHISRPSIELFERYKKIIPNFSLRMSNLQAALLRPQMKTLGTRINSWNERYRLLERELNQIDHVRVPPRDSKEHFVGSSIQFTLKGLTREQVEVFVDKCSNRGVSVMWFGWKEPRGYTSTFESWQYLSTLPHLPNTKTILDFMCDMRIPLTFSLDDCRTIAFVIKEVVHETMI
jgi:dTDP-4-amino-4,6-dideoxygalactose transaminase